MLNEANGSVPGAKPPIIERLRRYLFGDDIFISYSRADSDYALALAKALTEKKLSCFLDQYGSAPGSTPPPALFQSLRRSSMFVLVGTASAAVSANIQLEIEAFLETNRPIIPITFIDEELTHNTTSDYAEAADHGTLETARWFPLIDGIAKTVESKSALQKDVNSGRAKPSISVINRIVDAEGFNSRNKRLRRTFFSTLASLAVLLAIGGLTLFYFSKEAGDANLKAGKAEERANLAANLQTGAESNTRLAEARLGNAQADLTETNQKLANANTELKTAQTATRTEEGKRIVAEGKTKEALQNELVAKQNEDKALKSALAATKRAAFVALQEQAGRGAVIARQPGRQLEGVKMAVKAARANFSDAKPDEQIINGLTTSVIATDFAVPLPIAAKNIGLVQLSPDGSRLFVESSAAGKVRWEIMSIGENKSTRLLKEFAAPLYSEAYSASISRNNSRIAVSTLDGTEVWDLRDSKSQPTIFSWNIKTPALNDSGDQMVYAQYITRNDKLATDQTLIVHNLIDNTKAKYDLEKGITPREIVFTGNDEILLTVAEEGKGVADYFLSFSPAHRGGKKLPYPETYISGNLKGVTDDGSIVMASLFSAVDQSYDSSIYKLRPGDLMVTRTASGFKRGVKSISLGDPMRIVVANGGHLSFADAYSTPDLFSFRTQRYITDISWSADGDLIRSLSLGGPGNIWTRRGEFVRMLDGQTSTDNVAFSSNTQVVAAAGQAQRFVNSLRIWDRSKGDELVCENKEWGNIPSPGLISFISNDRFVATVHGGATLIVWSAATCLPVAAARLLRHGEDGDDVPGPRWNANLELVRFSPDGQLLVTEDRGSSPHMWDLNDLDLSSAKPLASPPDLSSLGAGLVQLKPKRSGLNEQDHLHGFTKVGNVLKFFVRDTNGAFKIVEGGRSIPLSNELDIPGIALFSNDGRRLLTADVTRQEVKIWDAASGQLILSIGTFIRNFSKAAISPNGDSFAVGGEDGLIGVYPTTPQGFLKAASGMVGEP